MNGMMGLLRISRAFFLFFFGEALCIVILISRGSSVLFFFRAYRTGLRMNGI